MEVRRLRLGGPTGRREASLLRGSRVREGVRCAAPAGEKTRRRLGGIHQGRVRGVGTKRKNDVAAAAGVVAVSPTREDTTQSREGLVRGRLLTLVS